MVKANRLLFAARIPEAQLFRAQGRKCFYCGCQLTRASATRDHLIPRALGRDLALNKVMACRKCNCRKGHRLPTQDELSRARALYASLGIPSWEIG